MNSKPPNFIRMQEQRNKSSKPRERRYFSKNFRKARVKEYETGEATVIEISRAYGVSSRSVYKWIEKYSVDYQKPIVTIVEPKSETRKRLQLEEKVKKLEQLLGKKQVKLEFLEKLIETVENHYGIEVKKTFLNQL